MGRRKGQDPETSRGAPSLVLVAVEKQGLIRKGRPLVENLGLDLCWPVGVVFLVSVSEGGRGQGAAEGRQELMRKGGPLVESLELDFSWHVGVVSEGGGGQGAAEGKQELMKGKSMELDFCRHVGVVVLLSVSEGGGGQGAAKEAGRDYWILVLLTG